ncbi:MULTISPECIES: hypothetical protein [unclassified Mesorhizobium]|uniref:hypothetical protein n=1 Tax=unclassified Mesorhizobium TaxID=325217 RepID=UPI0008F422C9|nr:MULTISPECIES: hypothetical protein [unclassified Mesorhizobium]RJG46326.1 hypothetical protein D3Y55_20175 [Mesorhizobium sp. DCY119]SFU00373.1 hypothetical protein SAMN05518861_109168 [Mesorhizobium sp. YR577]
MTVEALTDKGQARGLFAEIGMLYLRVATVLLALIGIFALVGTQLGWFTPDMPTAKKVLQIDRPASIAGAQSIRSKLIPVDTSRRYRIGTDIRVLPKEDGSPQISTVYLGVQTYDAKGKALNSGPGPYRFAGAANVQINSQDGWTRLEGVIAEEGDESHYQFRPGTKAVEVIVMPNYKADKSVVSELRNVEFTQIIELDNNEDQ